MGEEGGVGRNTGCIQESGQRTTNERQDREGEENVLYVCIGKKMENGNGQSINS